MDGTREKWTHPPVESLFFLRLMYFVIVIIPAYWFINATSLEFILAQSFAKSRLEIHEPATKKTKCSRKWFGNEKKMKKKEITCTKCNGIFCVFLIRSLLFFCLLLFFFIYFCCLRIPHENVHCYSWHFVWNYEKYTNANIFTWVVIERRMMMIKCMHKSNGMCLPCAKAFTATNKWNK